MSETVLILVRRLRLLLKITVVVQMHGRELRFSLLVKDKVSYTKHLEKCIRETLHLGLLFNCVLPAINAIIHARNRKALLKHEKALTSDIIQTPIVAHHFYKGLNRLQYVAFYNQLG